MPGRTPAAALVAILLVAAPAISASVVLGQPRVDETPPEAAANTASADHGGGGGWRGGVQSTQVLDAGTAVELDYQGEVFRGFDLVPVGRARYAGLVDVTVRIDTAAAGWWSGGEFFVVAENGQGSGFSAVAGGVTFRTSDIVSRPHTELSQWGYRHALADGRVSVLLGRQDVNQMFCVNGPGGGFIEPSFTLIPTVPMPTFPAPALGVALVLEPTPPFALRAGFFDGGPRISFFGVDTFFDHAGGTFSVLEPAWRPEWGANGELRGSYRLGLWYHSGSLQDPDVGGARQLDGDYGAYLMAQQVVAGNGARDGRLAVFLQAGWSPRDRNSVPRYVGLGVVSTGPLPSRPHDALGFGLNRTWVVADTARAETVTFASVELFYQVVLASWFRLQPDVQYYGRAGTAVGVRWLVHL